MCPKLVTSPECHFLITTPPSKLWTYHQACQHLRFEVEVRISGSQVPCLGLVLKSCTFLRKVRVIEWVANFKHFFFARRLDLSMLSISQGGMHNVQMSVTKPSLKTTQV